MTVDELLDKAEEAIEGRGTYFPNVNKGLALTLLALVKMLKEIEDNGRADPEL